jgi:ribose transport system ATP-binding protein
VTNRIEQPALRLEAISKRFGATQALRDVNLEVGAGKIHSFLGANGSGKSTLIKILSGYHTPDGDARVWVRGNEESFPLNPAKAGIAIVHQELGLLAEGSILENVGVSSSYGAGRTGLVSWRGERDRAQRILKRLGSDLRVGQRVSSLEPADRTIVGIARALRLIEAEEIEDPILLLDEPTVTLPPPDVERLFAVMREIAASNGSVIFITHRLREALDASDTISVLRDGRLVETRDREGVEVRDLVEAMHGAASEAIVFGEREERERRTPGEVVLEVRDLCGGNVRDINFSVRRGEVVGVTGLAGMGQDVLPYLLNGAATADSGDVVIDDKPTRRGLTPKRSWNQGVALVPANRAEQAIWPEGTVTENYTIVGLPDFIRSGCLSRSTEARQAHEAIEAFSVRAAGVQVQMKTLSGGNQQKVVIGRALRRDPKILLLHEPFIGIDAAARAEVLTIIDQAAAKGCAVVLFSIEYELLTSSCDRVLVMSHGQVVSELAANDGLSETAIARAAQEA